MNTGLILGDPGCGKTRFANRLIQAHRHPRRRFLVWSEWGGYRGCYFRSIAALRRERTWPPVAIVTGGRPDELLALALEVGSTTVVVDEVQHLAPTGPRPAEGSPLWRVLHEGRHPRVFLLGVTQFPYQVNDSLRNAAYWLFVYPLGDSTQRNYISARCGRPFADLSLRNSGEDPLLWAPHLATAWRSGEVLGCGCASIVV